MKAKAGKESKFLAQPQSCIHKLPFKTRFMKREEVVA